MRTLLPLALLLAAAAATAQPPPVYDFCDDMTTVAFDAAGQASYADETCQGENLVLDHECGVWRTTFGAEDRYAVALDPGCTVTAVVAHAGDAMLMVTDTCIVYGTQFTCLIGADAAGSGGVETIAWTNDGAEAVTVYVIVDTEQPSECGEYAAVFTRECPVPSEPSRWGAVKRRYR